MESGYEDLGRAKVVLDDGRLSGSVVNDGRFVMYACLGRVYATCH